MHILESNLNPPDWDYALTVPTDAEDQYSVVAPTRVNSTETEGAQRSTFMVRARVSTGLIPRLLAGPQLLRGYSIDNPQLEVLLNPVLGSRACRCLRLLDLTGHNSRLPLSISLRSRLRTINPQSALVRGTVRSSREARPRREV